MLYSMKRSGTADLPLHGGRVPVWLAERMTKLGTAIVEALVHDMGRSAFLSRISDPFWFQALGCVMGMDWHSSGITTSVMGALKRGLNPISRELGIYVCGGRGRHSRGTPQELADVGARTGLDADTLVRASRLSAKVDNTCVQDGFQIYLHTFVVSEEGEWAVVQQGMNPGSSLARRYHWHSARVKSFVSDPQAAVVGENAGLIVNVSDGRAERARSSIVEFAGERPEAQMREIQRMLAEPHSRLVLPGHHEVRSTDVDPGRLGGVLALAWERKCADFADVLLLKGLGPRTMQSLALVSEVIYGAPTRFEDPARFSFAHGGKDGHPFPVPVTVYDQSIRVLQRAVEKARLGRNERLDGLRKLSALSRRIEDVCDPHADIGAVIRRERDQSRSYGGRTVFRKAPRTSKVSTSEQLELFGPEPSDR